jgi:hypothetical protein
MLLGDPVSSYIINSHGFFESYDIVSLGWYMAVVFGMGEGAFKDFDKDGAKLK